MIEQRVVRVFPQSWTVTTHWLDEYLSEGWRVVMVTVFSAKSGDQFCDYIVERTVT